MGGGGEVVEKTDTFHSKLLRRANKYVLEEKCVLKN